MQYILVLSLLVTELVIGPGETPGRLPVVPLMLFVRVHVEVVFLGGAVLIPLFLAVTLLATVGAVEHAQFDLGGQGHTFGGGHYRLATDGPVLLRAPRILGFLTCSEKIFQLFNCSRIIYSNKLYFEFLSSNIIPHRSKNPVRLFCIIYINMMECFKKTQIMLVFTTVFTCNIT